MCTFGEGRRRHESDMGPAHVEISVGRETDSQSAKQRKMTFLRRGKQCGVGHRGRAAGFR